MQKTFKLLEADTCVRFKEVDPSTKLSNNYLILKTGKDCESNLGPHPKAPTAVSLGGCNVSFYISKEFHIEMYKGLTGEPDTTEFAKQKAFMTSHR